MIIDGTFDKSDSSIGSWLQACLRFLIVTAAFSLTLPCISSAEDWSVPQELFSIPNPSLGPFGWGRATVDLDGNWHWFATPESRDEWNFVITRPLVHYSSTGAYSIFQRNWVNSSDINEHFIVSGVVVDPDNQLQVFVAVTTYSGSNPQTTIFRRLTEMHGMSEGDLIDLALPSDAQPNSLHWDVDSHGRWHVFYTRDPGQGGDVQLIHQSQDAAGEVVVSAPPGTSLNVTDVMRGPLDDVVLLYKWKTLAGMQCLHGGYKTVDNIGGTWSTPTDVAGFADCPIEPSSQMDGIVWHSVFASGATGDQSIIHTSALGSNEVVCQVQSSDGIDRWIQSCEYLLEQAGELNVFYVVGAFRTEPYMEAFDFKFCRTSNPNNPTSDTDADSRFDRSDNCPMVANLDQRDSDNDRRGDACDNCPLTANYGQADVNGNSVGDICEGTAVLTPVGEDVTVHPIDQVTITFEEIGSTGVTEVRANAPSGSAPSGFQIQPLTVPVQYDVVTNATFAAPITLCFGYNPIELSGLEEDLRLYHYSGTPPVWQDVTVSLDTDADLICGQVESLSPFVLVLPCVCVGTTGNVDGDPGDITDISDLSAMVDFLFFGGAISSCPSENDVDISGSVDISDLSMLVDFLFFGGTLPNCP